MHSHQKRFNTYKISDYQTYLKKTLENITRLIKKPYSLIEKQLYSSFDNIDTFFSYLKKNFKIEKYDTQYLQDSENFFKKKVVIVLLLLYYYQDFVTIIKYRTI